MPVVNSAYAFSREALEHAPFVLLSPLVPKALALSGGWNVHSEARGGQGAVDALLRVAPNNRLSATAVAWDEDKAPSLRQRRVVELLE